MVLRARQDRGEPVPMLDNAPQLSNEYLDVWWLYWVLRRASPSDQPLVLSEILSILRVLGWVPEWERYVEVLQEMDIEFHTVMGEKREQRQAIAKKRQGVGKHG